MRILITLLLFCCYSSLISQNHLAQVKTGDLWGYVSSSGEVKIKPAYEVCHAFSADGYAAVYDKGNKQYSFIDVNGNKLDTELKEFDLKKGIFGTGLRGFNSGLVPVGVKKKWGYMNTSGKLAIPLKYEEVTGFNNGSALAMIDDTYYVVDASGNEIEIKAEIVNMKEFSEGLAPVKSGKMWGFVDTKGGLAIPANYKSVGSFSNGFAWAKNADGKLGYIDKNGSWKIQPNLTAGKNFDGVSNKVLVKSEDTWQFMNSSGDLEKFTDADKLGNYSDGLAKAMKGELWGYVNATGAWAIEPGFSKARDFKNGLAAIQKGDKWGFIDKSGNMVIEPSFDASKDMEMIK